MESLFINRNLYYTWLYQTFLYWTASIILTIFFYIINEYSFNICSYEWRRDIAIRRSIKYVWEDIIVVLFNQFVCLPLFIHFICNRHYCLINTEWIYNVNSMDLVYYFVICLILEEIGFYYTHRWFHHPVLYDWFHQFHHRWIAPIAIVALSAHPIEFIVTNLVPLFLGPIILGMNMQYTFMWMTLATFNVIAVHSGIAFAGKMGGFHDLHHRYKTVNYGVIGLMDYIHQTKR